MFQNSTQSSQDQGRLRDAQLLWLLSQHPVTPKLLTQMGWFPTEAKARKRLLKLRLRRRIKLVGTLIRGRGRPESVYARYWVKPELVEHEVELTALCFRLQVDAIHRGQEALAHPAQPDAILELGEQRLCLELDRGSMGRDALQRRFRVYARSPQLSLWVAPTSTRRDLLRSWATELRGTALFTTWAEAIHDPHQPIWWAVDGQRASLPRESDLAQKRERKSD